MKRIIFLSSFAIALIVMGCSKDGSEDEGGTKMELITSASWKYDTAVAEFGGNTFAIPSGLLLNCDKDNIITLRDDGTGTVDEGGTKCDVASPQSYEITWEFNSNETAINIPQTLYGISGEVQIRELNASKLKLSKLVKVENPFGPIPDSVDVTAVVDLKH